MTTRFPHHELRGGHREVGRQHGEALRPMIRAHLDLIYTRGSQKSQLAPETARRWAPAQLWRLDAPAAIEASARCRRRSIPASRRSRFASPRPAA